MICVPGDLYSIVLDRIEADYDKEKKGVVEQVMCLIYASRRGLFLDTELTPLMEQNKFEVHDWSSLIVVMEDLLFSSGGLINFSNEDVRMAVKTRYMSTEYKEVPPFFHS